MEQIASLRPDLVVFSDAQSQFVKDKIEALGIRTLAVWKELPTLRAVREGRVYPVRDETVLHPSQFVGDTTRKFAELIHPEAFEKK